MLRFRFLLLPLILRLLHLHLYSSSSSLYSLLVVALLHHVSVTAGKTFTTYVRSLSPFRRPRHPSSRRSPMANRAAVISAAKSTGN